MKLNEIHIRDPFVLCADGRYYMYGTRVGEPTTDSPWDWGEQTGFDVYVSNDLCNWSEPQAVFERPEGFWADKEFWAPEVHIYNGRYYLIASFKGEGYCRGCQIMAADSPMGPFSPISDGPATPREWECLDGTLYVDKGGKPHLVFCHEWLQVHNGEMCALPLSDDLSQAVGEPRILFRAGEPDWADKDTVDFVTDGPFLHRTTDGDLIMLWSSRAGGRYLEAMAVSDNGDISGNWCHADRLLFGEDGGHGMIFTDYSGRLMFVMHRPDNKPDERPTFRELVEKDGLLSLK